MDHARRPVRPGRTRCPGRTEWAERLGATVPIRGGRAGRCGMTGA